MSQKVFFTAVVILYVILGVGNLLAPQEFIAGFGVTLTPAGVLMARVVATAAIAFAIIYWACRDAAPSRLFTAVLLGQPHRKGDPGYSHRVRGECGRIQFLGLGDGGPAAPARHWLCLFRFRQALTGATLNAPIPRTRFGFFGCENSALCKKGEKQND